MKINMKNLTMTVVLFGSMSVYATTASNIGAGDTVANADSPGHTSPRPMQRSLPQNDIDQEAAGSFDEHKSQDRYLDAPAAATAEDGTINRTGTATNPEMNPEMDSSIASQRDNTVVSVQEALNNLDYEAGSADGVMGPNTMAALEKFQQENDLTPTGRLNAETLEALEIDNQSMYNDDLEDSAFAE